MFPVIPHQEQAALRNRNTHLPFRGSNDVVLFKQTVIYKNISFMDFDGFAFQAYYSFAQKSGVPFPLEYDYISPVDGFPTIYNIKKSP